MSTTAAHTHTILIIEAAQKKLTSAQDILLGAGYRLILADNPKDIRASVTTAQPGLVLIEAGPDFHEALAYCEAITRPERSDFLPVVITAPTTTPEQHTAALTAGAAALLPPEPAAVFTATLSALLAQKARFDRLLKANHRLQKRLDENSQQLATIQKSRHELDIIKTAIVNNVGHELRTPVLQIKSAIALLVEEARTTDTDGIPKLLDMAQQATARLEHIVTNITQLAEIQNLKLEPVSLGESIDLAIRNLERRWASQADRNRIHKKYTPPIPPVIGDKRGVVQVIHHLLDNALKFSPEGGKVEIIVHVQDNNTVWVGVRDYGIGIRKEQINPIFDSFYQVEAGSTRRFSGVGIGLTLAAFILEQMNSRIDVISTPGEGSTFSFVLPLADMS